MEEREGPRGLAFAVGLLDARGVGDQGLAIQPVGDVELHVRARRPVDVLVDVDDGAGDDGPLGGREVVPLAPLDAAVRLRLVVVAGHGVLKVHGVLHLVRPCPLDVPAVLEELLLEVEHERLGVPPRDDEVSVKHGHVLVVALPGLGRQLDRHRLLPERALQAAGHLDLVVWHRQVRVQVEGVLRGLETVLQHCDDVVLLGLPPRRGVGDDLQLGVQPVLPEPLQVHRRAVLLHARRDGGVLAAPGEVQLVPDRDLEAGLVGVARLPRPDVALGELVGHPAHQGVAIQLDADDGVQRVVEGLEQVPAAGPEGLADGRQGGGRRRLLRRRGRQGLGVQHTVGGAARRLPLLLHGARHLLGDGGQELVADLLEARVHVLAGEAAAAGGQELEPGGARPLAEQDAEHVHADDLVLQAHAHLVPLAVGQGGEAHFGPRAAHLQVGRLERVPERHQGLAQGEHGRVEVLHVDLQVQAVGLRGAHPDIPHEPLHVERRPLFVGGGRRLEVVRGGEREAHPGEAHEPGHQPHLALQLGRVEQPVDVDLRPADGGRHPPRRPPRAEQAGRQRGDRRAPGRERGRRQALGGEELAVDPAELERRGEEGVVPEGHLHLGLDRPVLRHGHLHPGRGRLRRRLPHQPVGPQHAEVPAQRHQHRRRQQQQHGQQRPPRPAAPVLGGVRGLLRRHRRGGGVPGEPPRGAGPDCRQQRGVLRLRLRGAAAGLAGGPGGHPAARVLVAVGAGVRDIVRPP